MPTRRQFLACAAAAGIGANLSCSSPPGPSPNAIPPRTGRRRSSFSFLHTYEATRRSWRAAERNNLVRPTTGVRLIHSPLWAPDEERFNAVARVGSPLHRILAERRCPFIIDRVAGGSPYAPYAFDQNLFETYARLLEGDFLGGQVHEILSNTHNDWDRLTRANGGDETSPIDPEKVRPFFTARSVHDQLELGALDDYAGRVRPKSTEQWWAEYERGAKRHIDRVGGRFSYCEGSERGWCAWPAFFKLGAARGLAEQGVWASPQGQLSIASLRGAARAYKRPWGVFWAPWGPDGCTAFTPPADWAWRVPVDFLKNTGWPAGPAHGPSTAVQRRLFFHAYLSGASTLHEEWGSETNFTDLDRATLSSSGVVVRELLDFQDAHRDVGVPYTPLALTLDAPHAIADGAAWGPVRATLFRNGHTDNTVRDLEGAGRPEANCYAPCSVPEVFDVVPADAPAEAWSRYQRVIPIDGKPGRADEVINAANELSPFARSSHLVMQVNHRASDNAWIVGLHNPWGAVRGDVYNVGSILDARCTQRDILRPKLAMKDARVIYAWPQNSTTIVSQDAIEVIVGPGGTLILEIHTA